MCVQFMFKCSYNKDCLIFNTISNTHVLLASLVLLFSVCQKGEKFSNFCEFFFLHLIFYMLQNYPFWIQFHCVALCCLVLCWLLGTYIMLSIVIHLCIFWIFTLHWSLNLHWCIIRLFIFSQDFEYWLLFHDRLYNLFKS